MSFPRYPAYRASGIEWLPDVPAHWDVLRLKQACEVLPSNVDKKSVAGERTVMLCNYTDVYYNDRIGPDLDFMVATATDDQIDRLTLRAGDTIVTKDSETADDIAVSAFVPADLRGVICGYHLSVIRPNTPHCGAFVKRLFDSAYVKACVAVRANGLTRVALGQYDLDNLELPFAPPDEQAAIASFLDRETAKIDELAEEQRRLIALLDEKRQAVISHAVTKGLNPDAPMKDSGGDVLGAVPKHWDVGPLKRYWTVTDCKHVTPAFVDSGIPLASIREVQGRWVELENARCTTEEFYEVLIEGGREPRPGDLIFSRNVTVGEVAQVAPFHPRFAMGQDVALLRAVSVDRSPDYWQLLLRSSAVSEQIQSILIGSTFKRVNVEEIRSLAVLSPPPTEQALIAERLLIEALATDSLIAEAVSAIALLLERRAALITAAVTGQIDVRALALTEAP